MRAKRTKRWTLKQQAQFTKLATAFLRITLGAKPTAHAEYRVETKYGPLTVHVLDTWIAQRFDYVDLGSKAVTERGHKWNFHFDGATDPRDAVWHWREQLERVLLPKGAAVVRPPPIEVEASVHVRHTLQWIAEGAWGKQTPRKLVLILEDIELLKDGRIKLKVDQTPMAALDA